MLTFENILEQLEDISYHLWDNLPDGEDVINGRANPEQICITETFVKIEELTEQIKKELKTN